MTCVEEGAPDLGSFIEDALPTRSRPGGRLDGPGAWLAFKRCLDRAIAHAQKRAQSGSLEPQLCEPLLEALEWLASHRTESEPQGLGPAQAKALARMAMAVMGDMRGDGLCDGIAPMMSWLAARGSPEALVEVARLPLELEGRALFEGESQALAQAVRQARIALVKTPDDYYEKVVAQCHRECTGMGRSDLKTMAHWTYFLGDDRPHPPIGHRLQPMTLIREAQALGAFEQEDAPWLIPLILEAPPMSVKRLRTCFNLEDCHYLYAPRNESVALATMIAAALRFGQSPFPAVQWAMTSGPVELAPLLLSLEDEGAFALLLPHIESKKVLGSLDKVAAQYPAHIFRMMLGAALAGSVNGRIVERLWDAIGRNTREGLARWAKGEAKALRYIDRALALMEQRMAAAEDLPTVLRDPPWNRLLDKGEKPSKSDQGGALPLRLEPIATPFAFLSGSKSSGARASGKKRYCPPIDEAIRAVVHFAALQGPGDEPFSIPRVEVATRAQQAKDFFQKLDQSIKNLRSEPKNFSAVFDGGDPQERALIYLLLKDCPGKIYHPSLRQALFTDAMQRYGQRAMPAICKLLAMNGERDLDLIEDIDSGSIAPIAARAFVVDKKGSETAKAWLTRFWRTAIMGLIPDVLSDKKLAKEAAINALRWIASRDQGAWQEIEHIGQIYARGEPRVLQELSRQLPADPLLWHPTRVAKVPGWLFPGILRRPQIPGGTALPDGAIKTLVQMLSFATQEEPYAGLEQVRRAAAPKTLAAFCWDLFSCWLANDCPPRERYAKDDWVVRSLEWFGDDECARRLARLIGNRPWRRSEGAASAWIEVLARMKGSSALMELARFAENARLGSLQDKALEQLAQEAGRRGLSPDELADALVPEFGLDDRGGLDLDFGPRRFRAGFDEFIKPWVRDEGGAMLPGLPKASKSDDGRLAHKASSQWREIRAGAGIAASLLTARLESMLAAQRRIAPEAFWRSFASHRLARHLAGRLVWGAYPDDDPASPPTMTFRVTETLDFAGPQDEPIVICIGAGAKARIGLAHPMNMAAYELGAWRALFSEMEKAQPFEQLWREGFEFTQEEKSLKRHQAL